MKNAPESTDAYMARLEEPNRTALENLRAILREEAPDAVEYISYGMPGLMLDGKTLCYYAAATHHCSLYPASGLVIEALAPELAGFSTSKGTIRFTPDNPIPPDLVRRIVRMRIEHIRG